MKNYTKKGLLTFLAASLLLLSLTTCAVNAKTVDETVTIPGPGYATWWASLDEGDTITAEFTVTAGGTINFFICTETVFNDWKDDASTSMTRYEIHNNVVSGDLEFEVPSDATWHIVLYNSALSSKTVDIKAEMTTAGEEALVTIMAILILVIIVVAIYLGIKKVRARGVEEELASE